MYSVSVRGVKTHHVYLASWSEGYVFFMCRRSRNCGSQRLRMCSLPVGWTLMYSLSMQGVKTVITQAQHGPFASCLEAYVFCECAKSRNCGSQKLRMCHLPVG